MFVLALDCSTARGGLALGCDDLCIWQKEFATGRGQGGLLFTALAEAMHTVQAADGRLAQIVVGLGPGSYSGVRQAIAAATGLALSTGARLVGAVSAAALEVDATRYQAVGDARRGTFYYTAVEQGVCAVGPELVETALTLQRRLAERDEWPVFAVETHVPALPTDGPIALPAAARLLALPKAAHVTAPLEPIYLRAVAFTLPKAGG